MITVTLFRSHQQICGFESKGHAGYAQEGSDIVCSAVSALLINTANSIERFAEDPMSLEQGKDGGYLKLMLKGTPSKEAALLMDSLSLGLKMIEETYGHRYLTIREQMIDDLTL